MPNLHDARATLDRLFEFRSLAVEPVRHPVPLPSIRLKGMGFAYDGQEICTGVDLTIRAGERVLVMGRNGSGKTTLAHVLAGFLQPTSGEAQVPGVPRVSAPFFPPSFLPGSIRRNVGFERLSSEKKDLLDEIARLLDIQGQLDEDPQELSAGQRQKTSVLRALLKDAELYIFDPQPPALKDWPNDPKG